MNMKPRLIIDAMNLFIRSWAAYPAMNVNGEAIGGCVGFLKTMERIITNTCPNTVHIIWESGGSRRRRAIYAEYKTGCRPERLNRFYEDDLQEDENDNKKKQLIMLIGALKTLPVCQVYVSDCEADDVIAYMCKSTFKNDDKVIASSDKDMYQLLDEHTCAYNLHKKIFITTGDVFNEFRIKAFNFAVAKSLCGDGSDNIPGIKGLGFKTASKRIPLLGGEKEVSLSDVFDYCASHLDEAKAYRNIVENKQDVLRNWKLVYLDGGMLSATQVSKIEHTICTFEPRVDKMKFIKCLVDEGISDFDVDSFFYSFNGLTQ